MLMSNLSKRERYFMLLFLFTLSFPTNPMFNFFTLKLTFYLMRASLLHSHLLMMWLVPKVDCPVPLTYNQTESHFQNKELPLNFMQ